MTDFEARLRSLTAEPSSDRGDDAPRRARVERTRTEMMSQGTVLRAALANARDGIGALADAAAARGITRIVLAGCGDSWFAGIAARLGLERATGLPVEPVQALDWALYAAETAGPETLVIGLSSGGATPAVVAALDTAQARGALCAGVSNTDGSHVLTAYDGGLFVAATRTGWPTQSSTAAAGVLLAFGAALGRRLGHEKPAVRLDAAVDAVAGAMDTAAHAFDARAEARAEETAAANIVIFSGAGPHYAAAAFGAAKIKELGPIHALAMPLEEYHHYRAQKRGDPLFLVAPDAASRERALDTALVSAHVGGRTVALKPGPDAEIDNRVAESWHMGEIAAEVAPLLYSVPLHLYAYHFAMARFARNLGYPSLAAEPVA